MSTPHTGSTRALADALSSSSENEFRLFIKDKGQQLDCAYCGNRFGIASYEELARARYVQTQLGSGIKRRAGPFCCRACYQGIKEGRVKYCLECGRGIVSGNYCSLKCAIAFCED